MSNFLTLLGGELQRMQKYHIFTASLFVALLWIGMLHLLEVDDIGYLFMMIVFFDLVSMSILMIGVTIYFEKQEGVLSSMFVAPVNKTEFISSKTVGNLFSNLVTILAVLLYVIFFQDINISIPMLAAAVLLIGLFHSLVGFLLIYYSRGFTDLLIAMMKYILLFMIPVILELTGVITGELYSNLLYVIPTKSSATLVEAVIGRAEFWEVFFSIVYLSGGSVLLLYFVFKRFKDFAVRESGV